MADEEQYAEVPSVGDGEWTEWVQPRRKLYGMACCDCGLVHDMQFKLVKYGDGKHKIRFRVRRNERDTAMIRERDNIRIRSVEECNWQTFGPGGPNWRRGALDTPVTMCETCGALEGKPCPRRTPPDAAGREPELVQRLDELLWRIAPDGLDEADCETIRRIANVLRRTPTTETPNGTD